MRLVIEAEVGKLFANLVVRRGDKWWKIKAQLQRGEGFYATYEDSTGQTHSCVIGQTEVSYVIKPELAVVHHLDEVAGKSQVDPQLLMTVLMTAMTEVEDVATETRDPGR